MVQALSQTFGKEFGLTKNCFDLTIVALSLLGGLLFSHRIVGVGAGTIVNALLVGRLATLFRKVLGRPMERLRSGAARVSG
jgi:uncharacterized membrane protein YczE